VTRPILFAILGVLSGSAATHAQSLDEVLSAFASKAAVATENGRLSLRYDAEMRLRWAELRLVRGRTLALHRFNDRLWFADGESAEPLRLGHPVPGAQVSSRFGTRNDTAYAPIKNIGPLGRAPRVVRSHPLLTPTWSFHSGVDLVAPVGTPVLAAADGTVRHVGRDAALGNLVVVEHDRQLTTRYGHLAGSAPGIAPGTEVRRGEALGFVGSSGLSSGPHLHYELLANGRVVDPLGHAATRPQRLHGRELEKFRQQVRRDAAQRALGE
jgi:murein DD-endopeptidase MepM/ murein hydrolase activator NlpD